MEVKIAINTSYGGFSLSEEASEMFNDLKGLKKDDEYYVDPKYGYINCPRYDSDLIKVIETLGEKAKGNFSRLQIVTLSEPRFRIQEYDGSEWIETPDGIKWDIIDTPEAREEFPEYFI